MGLDIQIFIGMKIQRQIMGLRTGDQLVQGEIDWAGNFLPAVDRTFVARDPEHHVVWYRPGGNVFLYANNHYAGHGPGTIRDLAERLGM